MGCQCLAHNLRKHGVTELDRGHIDRHLRQIEPHRVPGFELSASLVENERTNLLDQSAILCQRDEPARRYEAKRRMIPARQRLCPRQPTRTRIDLWLEV